VADAQIKITADTSQAERALGNLQSTISNLASAVIGGAIGKQLIDIADAATILSNKLKTVTNSSADAGIAFNEVARIAKLTGTNIEAVGDLFQKVSLAGQTMGLTLQDSVAVTENFSKALAITGTTGIAASSAMYQFGQSLGRGTVAFEDMKQLQESSAGTLDLIAKQFGKTTAQFLKDVQNYKVGSRDLAAALKQMGSEIDPTFNGMQKTVGQSLQNIRTEFIKTVQKFEDATGAFAKLANGIAYVGDNLDTIIPIAAAFVGAFAATKILASVLALYEMVKVLRAVGTVGAVAGALATGGLTAITAAAGAFLAYQAVDKLFDDMEEKAVLKKQADEAKRLADEAKKAAGVTNALGYQGAEIDFKGLAESAKTFNLANDTEAKLIGLGKYRVEQEKAVLAFAKDQNVAYEKISESQVASTIRLSVLNKIIAQERQDTALQIRKLESESTTNAIADQGVRQVTAQLETYRLSVHEKTYALEKDSMKASIEKTIQTRMQAGLQDNLVTSQIELTSLATKDLDVRQIELAVAKERQKYGVLFTAEAEATLRATLANNQALQVGLALEKQRALSAGQAIPQTQLDKNAMASGVQMNFDPALQALSDYQTKKQAIMDADIGIVNNKNTLLQQLEYDHQQKMLSIEQAQGEMRLKQAGVNNQAILDSVKANQANAVMIQQGGVVAAQGMLGALSGIMGSMSTQSEKAFRAHKALAVAQAVISTYQAAASAIAFPPGPPISLLYVAGAIAAGFAQVNAIKSQQYTGRALGGPVTSGRSYIVGENGPEMFTPGAAGNITPNNEMGMGTTNINFTVVANDTTGFDQLLTSRRGMIQQIVSDAMLEKGRRM
jgi:tape measure domain-containing protein